KQIKFSPDGSRIYGYLTFGVGYGFLRLAVGTNGLTLSDATTAIPSAHYVEMDQGLVFDSSGNVIDPIAPRILGNCQVVGPPRPDAALNRVFDLTFAPGGWELRSCDSRNYQTVGAMPIT